MSDELTPYVVRFTTTVELTVTVQAEDEEVAAVDAWERASEYLETLGNHRDVRADASLDGIGADSVEEDR